MRNSLPFVVAAAALVLLSPSAGRASDRTLPMQFELRREGPAEACGAACRVLISASGGITADTPADFLKFAQSHDLSGALIVLDSDGGSVHGAIALGREIRRLALDTTVGRVVDLGERQPGDLRAKLSPGADCESMCAFVLMAGVRRSVPQQARVMVHQIWLGDRRDDPTAATYSAEDLVLVQRDIGRLARYSADMGGSIDMLDLALRIPPWERMHVLTRDEIAQMGLATGDPVSAVAASGAASPPAANTVPAAHLTDGVHAVEIGERRWAMVDRAGAAALARRHPLTVEGEDIGSFDLMVSCGADRDSYDVSYVERRHGADGVPLPAVLGTVTLRVAGREVSIKVVSSERRSHPDELVTYAAGRAPAALIRGFVAFGSRSLTIETRSGGVVTAIRLGNAGAQQLLPRLAARCVEPLGDRAGLDVQETGGLAAAK